MADAYLRFFEPDLFVEAERGLAKEAGIKTDLHSLGFGRAVLLDDFIQEDEIYGADFAYGQNVRDLYSDLYRREFQFVARNEKKFALIDQRRPIDPFFDAVVGNFPDDPRLRYLRQQYAHVFSPKSFSSTPEGWHEIVKDGYTTPFWVGRNGLTIQPSGGSDPRIFVFDPTKTVDLIDYWNLRQFGWTVFPVNVNWVSESIGVIKKMIERNHRPLPRNRQGVMITTTVEFSRSLTSQRVKSVIDTHFRQVKAGAWTVKTWYDPIWRMHWGSAGVQPRRVKIFSEDTDTELPLIEGDRSVTFRNLSPDFAAEYTDFRNTARWANVLQVQDYTRDSDIAVTYLPNVKDPTFPRLHVTGVGTSAISREGIVLLQHYKRHHEYVRLLRQQEAIIGWLKTQNIEARPSEAGRNAQEIIRSIGGLRGGWLFAHVETVKLLEKMAKTIRHTSSGDIEQYPDRTATVAEWKASIGRRVHSQQLPHITIKHFTDANIIRIGVALRCPHCANETWYNLSDLDYELSCERCLQRYEFPQAGISFGDSDWRYRVIGPFSIPNFAHGGYSTVLTLRVLNEILHTGLSKMTFSTGLDIEHAGQKFEIDFVAWYTEAQKFWVDPEPVFVFGESKSFGSDVFHQRDVDRLRRLAETFPGSFILFSTMKDGLGPAEKKRVRAFAEWGRIPSESGQPRAAVIVFTGAELFAQWNLNETWKKIGGKHAGLVSHPSVTVDDLSTLSDLTQQLYLDLAPYGEWHRTRLQRRRRKA